MSCIGADVLADYWLAQLDPALEESVEEHLLGCDECGVRLRQTIALADGIRKLAAAGGLRMIVSDAFLERAAQNGLRIRQYAPPAGGKVDCTVTVHDDLLIGRLAADLSSAQRVDLCMYDVAGVERGRLRDIPFHQATREIIFNEPIGPARAAPANVLLVNLMAVDAGGDHLLAQYTFNHSPSQ